MPEPSVAAGVARRMIDVAVARGADRKMLLTQSGILSETLDDQDARVPMAHYKALIRAAKAATNDSALVLHYAEEVNLADVSIVGMIGNASANMTDAFVQLQRYNRLVVEVDLGASPRFTNEWVGGALWLVDYRANPNDFPELTEQAFGQMVCNTRHFGTTPFVLAVEVTHNDPGYANEYERILGAPVTFNAARNAMRIDPAWLTHKIAETPHYTFGLLSNHAEALLSRLEASTSVRGQVESHLLPILHSGNAAIAHVSAVMGCSRQTLYRRLKAEGVTFAHILDALRHRMALDYMSARKVSVNETAYLLGFSDPAAFSRAFKRWTGVSPRAARHKLPYSLKAPT
ncbi:MAG: AraC family transcriptional regulator ligand-binding domain-containing protein [Sphingopyxis sp.]